MATTTTFLASANAASATLSTQMATLQSDLDAAGDVTTATVAQIAQLTIDAQAALTTAQSIDASYQALLAAANDATFASGTPAALMASNVALLIAATTGAAVAADTVNRLTRLLDNLQAIGS